MLFSLKRWDVFPIDVWVKTLCLNDEQIAIVKNELDMVVELINRNTFEEFKVRVLFI